MIWWVHEGVQLPEGNLHLPNDKMHRSFDKGIPLLEMYPEGKCMFLPALTVTTKIIKSLSRGKCF